MSTQRVDLLSLYFGNPVAILSSQNDDGTTNLSPISSWWILDQSIVFGLGTSGKCYENLIKRPEVVLNIPDSSLWENVEFLAATTGKESLPDSKKKMGYYFESDKFSCSGLTETESHDIKPGRIKECPVQIETRVVNAMFLGSHRNEMISMEAKVLNVHVSEEMLKLETGNVRFNVGKWKPLYYVFRHYFSLGEALGKNFRCSE
ncbi:MULTISPECIES: flavin reductase family protein [Rahnella]|uniref:Flavin reductase family protein n=1 Tax=Rahnella laticis TaxID=2787622 RepID=A0ABS0E2C7_9GAMM|nr:MULTISPECIES: flavin reductase family protein [Rahnella]MBF7979241.1 flavin reductase family protein [Rahnella laticis]MBF7999494.1 flavin reductase family protein [Rahnella sp. LAC-M12]